MENIFSNFENVRQRMNNKMFFFVEKTPGTFVQEKKLFELKVCGVARRNTKT